MGYNLWITSTNFHKPEDLKVVTFCKIRFVELRDAGVDDVACDILLGLAGTSVSQMLQVNFRSSSKSLSPYRIDIFMITPTHEYVDSHRPLLFELFWSHLRRFEKEVLPLIPQIAKENGYNLLTGVGHRMTLKSQKKINVTKQGCRSYNPLSHQQGSPVNVLAFGPSARGSIFNTLPEPA